MPRPRKHGNSKGRGYYSRIPDRPVTYFIQDGDAVKIGFAKDIWHRLSCLQVGNPRPLTLLRAVRADDKRLEVALHKTFADHHVRGEWFAAGAVIPWLAGKSDKDIQEIGRAIPA